MTHQVLLQSVLLLLLWMPSVRRQWQPHVEGEAKCYLCQALHTAVGTTFCKTSHSSPPQLENNQDCGLPPWYEPSRIKYTKRHPSLKVLEGRKSREPGPVQASTLHRLFSAHGKQPRWPVRSLAQVGRLSFYCHAEAEGRCRSFPQ